MKKDRSTFTIFCQGVKTHHYVSFLFSILFASFLVCLFSSNSFAYDVDVYPRDTASTFRFDTVIQGNCQLFNYVFPGGSTVKAGANWFGDGSKSDLYPCGYRWLNNKLQYYRYSSFQKQALYISGSTQQPTTDTFNVTSNNGLGDYDTFYNKDFDLYKAIDSITVHPDTSINYAYEFPDATSSLYDCTVKNPVGNYCDPRSVMVVTFDMDTSNSFEFPYLNMKFTDFRKNSYPYSADVFMIDINDSLFHYCSNGAVITSINDFISSLYPDFMSNIPDGYARCVVGAFIPLDLDGHLTLPNTGLNIIPAPASSYSREGWTTTDANGYLNSIVLPKYGYPWPLMYHGLSYKEAGSQSAYISALRLSNPRFIVINPTTASDVDATFPLVTTAMNNNQSLSDGFTDTSTDGDTPSNSVIQNWFDIFGGVVNVLFPFGSIFNGFTASDSCAYIPILSNMLHTSESTYCSWWPSDIISLFTPVFSILSMMLLFGFVVSWLKGDNNTVKGSV